MRGISLALLSLLSLLSLNVYAEGEHHQVNIVDFDFGPKVLLVKKGDRVTWVNKDVVKHNISAKLGDEGLSPDLAVGENYSMLVTKSMNYICGLHPSMTGSILIEGVK